MFIKLRSGRDLSEAPLGVHNDDAWSPLKWSTSKQVLLALSATLLAVMLFFGLWFGVLDLGYTDRSHLCANDNECMVATVRGSPQRCEYAPAVRTVSCSSNCYTVHGHCDGRGACTEGFTDPTTCKGWCSDSAEDGTCDNLFKWNEAAQNFLGLGTYDSGETTCYFNTCTGSVTYAKTFSALYPSHPDAVTCLDFLDPAFRLANQSCIDVSWIDVDALASELETGNTIYGYRVCEYRWKCSAFFNQTTLEALSITSVPSAEVTAMRVHAAQRRANVTAARNAALRPQPRTSP